MLDDKIAVAVTSAKSESGSNMISNALFGSEDCVANGALIRHSNGRDDFDNVAILGGKSAHVFTKGRHGVELSETCRAVSFSFVTNRRC